MLEQLAKRDKDWRRIAFNICKDKTLSDDLVQEMYLKMAECTKEINEYYVIRVMINLFKDNLKEQKRFTELTDTVKVSAFKFEFDDKEQSFINGLKWWEKELLELSHDNSCGQIEREYKIHRKFVERILKKTKDQWQDQKSNTKD
jgi:DNA-directed RNA polymerase specialized sigma24 family protein